jgi:hypothetical protein
MGFTTVIRSVLALAAALLLGGTLLAAAPNASAKVAPSTASKPAAERTTHTPRLASCPWRQRQCFGAISLNTRTGIVGYANDKRGKATAIRIAHNSCHTRSTADGGSPGQCTKAGWVRNGCLAVAIRINNGTLVEWGSGYAYNRAPAQHKAKNKVRGPGRIKIQFWLCTTRRR